MNPQGYNFDERSWCWLPAGLGDADDFDWDNSVSGGVLTQAQNSFEVWHNFAGAIPFSSE